MILFILNLFFFLMFIITLLIDQFKLSTLMMSTFLIMFIINSISNIKNQQIILQALINPIIVLLGCLGILGEVYQNSKIKKLLGTLFLKISDPLIFNACFLIIVFLLSGVINNSLIVSSFIPIIQEVMIRNKIYNNTYFITLSFASMLGGTLTLVGSSTNLLAEYLLQPEYTLNVAQLFIPSLITGIIGLTYLFTISNLFNYLGYKQQGCISKNTSVGVEIFCLKVDKYSDIINKQIKESNIQEVCGFQLSGIKRDDHFLANPHKSTSVILENDILIFVGLKILNKHCDEKLKNLYQNRNLVKIDIPESNPDIAVGKIFPYFNQFINKTIKDLELKNKHHLIVLGIFRDGKYIYNNLSETKVLKNDMFLVHGLNGTKDMIQQLDKFCHKNIILSGKTSSKLTDNIYSNILLIISLIGIVISGFLTELSTPLISIIICSFFLLFNILDYQDINYALQKNINVILLTSLSLGITKCLEISEVIDKIGKLVFYIKDLPRWYLFFITHLLTSFLSILLSNASVVAIMIPTLKLVFLESSLFGPLAISVIHGASCCFASPTGYHTNLMILNVGGYKCLDFIFIGIPLHFISSLIFSTSIFYLY